MRKFEHEGGSSLLEEPLILLRPCSQSCFHRVLAHRNNPLENPYFSSQSATTILLAANHHQFKIFIRKFVYSTPYTHTQTHTKPRNAMAMCSLCSELHTYFVYIYC